MLLGLTWFILGTVFTFIPTAGRITGGSPSSSAWQGLFLFYYSLIAFVHLLSKPKTALSNFVILRLVTYAFMVLMAIQALASIVAGIFFFTLVTIEVAAGLFALLTGCV